MATAKPILPPTAQDAYSTAEEVSSSESGEAGPLVRKVSQLTDAVHGSMELPQGLRAVLDTPEVQRLRSLLQLGVADLVYPTAAHSRFAHSVGVAHLARRQALELRARQPELGISLRDVLCLAIAGLCHDLGHGPFSHTYEAFLDGRGKVWHHEDMSVRLVRRILKRPSVRTELVAAGLGKDALGDDWTFIEELIHPPTDKAFKGRGPNKHFLYDIVSNTKSGFDVDRYDYILRDAQGTHVAVTFNAETLARLFQLGRVVKDPAGRLRIGYPLKARDALEQVGASRQRLHEKVYQHKTVIAIQWLLKEILRAADMAGFTIRGVSLTEAVEEGKEDVFLLLNNSVVDLIACQDLEDYDPASPALHRSWMGRAQTLIKAMAERHHPKLIMSHEIWRSADAPRIDAEQFMLRMDSLALDGKIPFLREDFYATKATFHYGVTKLREDGEVVDPRDDAVFFEEERGGELVTAWGSSKGFRPRECLAATLYIFWTEAVDGNCGQLLSRETVRRVGQLAKQVAEDLHVPMTPIKASTAMRDDTPPPSLTPLPSDPAQGPAPKAQRLSQPSFD